MILLGLPLWLLDSQIRPAWSPGDGVRCSCGVIVGSFQIPCRRQKEDKNGKRVKIPAKKKSLKHKLAKRNEPHIKFTSSFDFFYFTGPSFHFHNPKFSTGAGVSVTLVGILRSSFNLALNRTVAAEVRRFQPTWTPNLGM